MASTSHRQNSSERVSEPVVQASAHFEQRNGSPEQATSESTRPQSTYLARRPWSLMGGAHDTHLNPLRRRSLPNSQNKGSLLPCHLLFEPPVVVAFPESSEQAACACCCPCTGIFWWRLGLTIRGLVACCCSWVGFLLGARL